MGQRKGEKNVGWQPETQPKGKPPVEKTKGAETMQRLIDVDAVIEVQMYDEEHEDFYTEKMTVEDFICRYSEMPSIIDAIPIEWILSNERMPKEGKGRKVIMDMLEDWRKEHEQTD